MNKLRSLIVAALVLVFLISSTSINVLAATTTLLTESFDYSDAFTNHGWSYSNGGCGVGEINTPVVSPFTTYAFGYNHTNGCAFAYTRAIARDLILNITTGVLSNQFSIDIRNDTTKANNIFQYRLYTHQGGSNYLALTYDEASIYVDCGNQAGCVECNHSLIGAYPYSETNIDFQIDFDNDVYNVYIAGETGTSCSQVSFGSLANAYYLQLAQTPDDGENLTVYVDDITVSIQNTTTDKVSFNQPCDDDSDCAFGQCTGGFCVRIGAGSACDADGDCVSGSCINSVCAKAGVVDVVEDTVGQLFGFSDQDLNFMAMFLSIVIPLIFVYFARNAGFFGAIAGLSIHIVMMFLFTFIGWLSAFILVGEVVAILAIFVFIGIRSMNS